MAEPFDITFKGQAAGLIRQIQQDGLYESEGDAIKSILGLLEELRDLSRQGFTLLELHNPDGTGHRLAASVEGIILEPQEEASCSTD